jgi:hypothetical protein
VRILDLRPGFHSAQPRLAPRGSPAWQAVRAILVELMDDRVPLVRADDQSIALPMAVLGRAVPGTDLLVVFMPAGDVVAVIDIRRQVP